MIIVIGVKKKELGSKKSFFLTPGSIKFFLLKYKWLFVFFVPFFILQTYYISLLPWDSIPYVFAGKWFCGEQTYFEFIRPPLPGVINCLFGAQLFSIIISTALACFLYLASIILIYEKEKNLMDQFTLGLFAFLAPPILFFSNFGSDLFALSFLLLGLGVASSWKKGLFFALASLSRYNFLVFVIVFLWQLRKKPKEILNFLVVAVVVWVPWLVFNFLYTGDPLFSLNETIYLNVLNKGLNAPLNFEQILVIGLFVLSIFVAGIVNRLKDSKNHGAIISAVLFLISGIKETRFINLLTPATAINISIVSHKSHKLKLIFIILFLIIFIALLHPLILNPIGHWNYMFKKDVVPTDSFLYECKIASDKWVLFYPVGIVAQFLPGEERFEEYLSKGTNLVIYNYKWYDLNKFSSKIIDRGEYFIIKSDSCSPPPKKYLSGPWSYKVVNHLRETNSNLVDLSDWPE